MTDKVTLVSQKGSTSIYIDAEITADGSLVLSGQDLGEAPRQFFGASDYEYWLTIDVAHKDRVLLALLEKLYAGNVLVVSQMRELLKVKGIPAKFQSY